MKKIVSLFALSALPAVVMATEVTENDTTSSVAPMVPAYGFTAPPSHVAMLEQQRLIAEQHARFAEMQNQAMQQAFEDQRRFAEQFAQAARVAPAPYAAPGFALPEPHAFPEFPQTQTPYGIADLPQPPSSTELSKLSFEERRAAMRAYSQEVRKVMQEQRDILRQQWQAERTAAIGDRG